MGRSQVTGGVSKHLPPYLSFALKFFTPDHLLFFIEPFKEEDESYQVEIFQMFVDHKLKIQELSTLRSVLNQVNKLYQAEICELLPATFNFDKGVELSASSDKAIAEIIHSLGDEEMVCCTNSLHKRQPAR
jgi:hypothetical protein